MTRLALFALLFLPAAALAQPTGDASPPATGGDPTAPPATDTPPVATPPATTPPVTTPPVTTPPPEAAEPHEHLYAPDAPADDDDDDHVGRSGKPKHEAGTVTYKPGKGFFLKGGGATARIRTIVEPVVRFGYLDCGPSTATCPDPQIAMTIRRARLGVKTTLPHDLGLDVEVQVKNLHFGITHFYGSWQPSKHFELDVGFIKPPGNIERKVNTWETPWIERGVVSAWISIARVMGVMATGTSADKTVYWQAAVSKPVARGLDGAESEDQPPPRMGAIDPDDAIKGAGQLNFDGRLEWDPNKDLALGIAGGTRLRGDGDPGDNAPEPYDTPVAISHQYTGVMVHGAIDAVVRQRQWRLIAEVGARRDGQTAEINDDGSKPNGHLVGVVGDLTFGYTPNGKYAAAKDYAFLKHGYELLARINASRIAQPSNEQLGFGGVARFLAFEAGLNMQLHKQLRIQVDASYQWFGGFAYGANAGSKRVWGNVWAVWKM